MLDPFSLWKIDFLEPAKKYHPAGAKNTTRAPLWRDPGTQSPKFHRSSACLWTEILCCLCERLRFFATNFVGGHAARSRLSTGAPACSLSRLLSCRAPSQPPQDWLSLPQGDATVRGVQLRMACVMALDVGFVQEFKSTPTICQNCGSCTLRPQEQTTHRRERRFKCQLHPPDCRHSKAAVSTTGVIAATTLLMVRLSLSSVRMQFSWLFPYDCSSSCVGECQQRPNPRSEICRSASPPLFQMRSGWQEKRSLRWD